MYQVFVRGSLQWEFEPYEEGDGWVKTGIMRRIGPCPVGAAELRKDGEVLGTVMTVAGERDGRFRLEYEKPTAKPSAPTEVREEVEPEPEEEDNDE